MWYVCMVHASGAYVWMHVPHSCPTQLPCTHTHHTQTCTARTKHTHTHRVCVCVWCMCVHAVLATQSILWICRYATEKISKLRAEGKLTRRSRVGTCSLIDIIPAFHSLKLSTIMPPASQGQRTKIGSTYLTSSGQHGYLLTLAW